MSDADAAASLLLDETRRLLVKQQSDLESLRSRSTGLLGVVTVAAAVFSAAAARHQSRFASWGYAGVFVTFAAIASCAIVVLWPYKWNFADELSDIITKVINGEIADGKIVSASLARKFDKNYTKNAPRLNRLHWWFAAACALLGAHLVAWLVVVV